MKSLQFFFSNHKLVHNHRNFRLLLLSNPTFNPYSLFNKFNTKYVTMNTMSLSSSTSSPSKTSTTNNTEPLKKLKTDPTLWEKYWQDLKPGMLWDIGKTEPELQHILDHERQLIGLSSTTSTSSRPKALVPGCGRAYSVASLSLAGFDAIGLDIAEGAVEAAQEIIEIAKPHAKVELGDFFELNGNKEKFDLVFDSTFLCAIPPEKREAWAEQMINIIRPGGILIENCFPIYPEMDEIHPMTSPNDSAGSGPPFRLSTSLVENMLKDKFELLESRIVGKERRARLMTSQAKTMGENIHTHEVFMIFKRR
jgi:hypothetical protein